jgi:hypothetical protein
MIQMLKTSLANELISQFLLECNGKSIWYLPICEVLGKTK